MGHSGGFRKTSVLRKMQNMEVSESITLPLLIAVCEHLTRNILRRKGLFWLTV